MSKRLSNIGKLFVLGWGSGTLLELLKELWLELESDLVLSSLSTVADRPY
ncbi:MAG TPA: hypothetical protein VGF75_05900 [Candidatus Saccharimonadales bacterium]